MSSPPNTTTNNQDKTNNLGTQKDSNSPKPELKSLEKL